MPDTNENQQQGGTSGDQQQQPAPDQQQTTSGSGGMPDTWAAWLAAQNEEQRTVITRLYEAETTGLRGALKAERDGRAELERQVRDLQKTAEKGSDAERKLNEMVTALETANRRNEFLEQASKPDVGLADLDAAWIIIQAKPDEYVTKRGIDFALLKQRHSGLFRSAPPTPKGNAGSGTGNPAPNGTDMNAFIRRAAGHG